MKQFIIVALVCINAALIVALVFGAANQKAYGQLLGSNYLVITGQVASDEDAVWILNLGERRRVALRWNKSSKRLMVIGPSGGRDLRRDFGRRGRD